MRCPRRSRSFAATVPVIGLFLAAGPWATPSAAEGPPGEREARQRVVDSFVRFAQRWLSGARVGPAPDFSVELRSTGSARAPYVGLLRYREQVYECSGGDSRERCTRGTSVPVTEVFRFQDGRWVP